jgi:hypothetical protein
MAVAASEEAMRLKNEGAVKRALQNDQSHNSNINVQN